MDIVNPVLPGMHPDPSVCRVGRDFYLACSSFEYFPGVPLFHSRDLVHWRQIGNVLTRASQLDLRDCPSSGGVYAPTLRHHDGTFYLVTTLVGRGHFVVTARDPRGPWSDPHWLDDDGIDPSLTFAEGRVLYTRNGTGSDPDHPYVYLGELDGLDIADAPRVVWQGLGGIWPEAPHLYRRGDWWYLVTAEGGTSYGHSVVVARARDPYGPYEPSPHGPLLTHRDRPRHPIQAVGHADLVDLPDGSACAVLLGIRPRGGRHHHLGRETFLARVDWGDDGWPRTAGLEAVDPAPAPPRRTRFTGESLPPEWVFARNPPRGGWSLGDALTLRDTAVFRRQQHFDLTVRTRVTFTPRDANDVAGLCVRASDDYHAMLVVGLGRDGREVRLVRTANGRAVTLGRAPVAPGPVTLELRADAARYTLGDLGSVSTRLFSAESILAASGRHHFTGAMIGLCAAGAPADFHWFDYEAA